MVTFNFSYAPGVTLEQMTGFEMAGRIWSTYLTDNATINLYVEMTDRLDKNILGGSIPNVKTKQDYDQFRENLFQDAQSADDRLIKANLSSHSVQAQFDLYQFGININVGKELDTNRLDINSANAKAVGLISGTDTQLDGYILINKLLSQSVQWNYDYTRSSPAPANSVDFLSTILHEMGHVLGFVSSVDRSGWLSARVNTLQAKANYENNVQERATHATPLDLFRYSTESGNDPDLSIGGNIKFSLDSGFRSVASFASGKDTSGGGDGKQGSHWKDTTSATGIMDASLGLAERSAITTPDLRAFDVIGWDLSSQGINTPLNLTDLKNQSKQALAQRLGKTVAWLDANSATAAQQLVKDRTQDVINLIANSEVYNKGKILPTDPFGQILGLLGLEGVFEEFIPEDAKKVGDRHHNQIFGSAKTDMISGLAGSDHLVGNGGNDLMEGGKGRDRLKGGNGQDVLIGGRRSDLLIGGKGQDVFVLQPLNGCDVIQDFQEGHDQLGLSATLQFEKLGISQAGKNTLLVWEGQAIALLKGINASQISATDFVSA